MHFSSLLHHLLAGVLAAALVAAASSPRLSPAYTDTFRFPLPIPPVKVPLTTYTDPSTGVPIDFYSITITPFSKSFFPGLSPASLVGYDGQFPGPLFRIQRGRQTLIRFVNSGARVASVHLHGSFTRAPWDGWTADLLQPGEFKDYYYPNTAGGRTLWYHDHAEGVTTLNAYAGQVGMYIIVDEGVEARLGLPKGRFDVPLILSSYFFTKDGGISDESMERTSTYGDTFTVNGQILPHLEVEPRKYRFRLLDAAVSRTFNLTLMDGTQALPFWVIASDGGFRDTPVKTTSLMISMAERWEVSVPHHFLLLAHGAC